MKKLGLLLLLIPMFAHSAIYHILTTDYYVNGMPPSLTTAQKAKWLDSVNISETNAAIGASKYLPINQLNASKTVKSLDAGIPITYPTSSVDFTGLTKISTNPVFGGKGDCDYVEWKVTAKNIDGTYQFKLIKVYDAANEVNGVRVCPYN